MRRFKRKETIKRSRDAYALRECPASIGETNDCAVRSLAVAAGITYGEAYNALANVGRQPRRGVPMRLIVRALRNLQISHVVRPVGKLVRRLRRGSYTQFVVRVQYPTLKQVLEQYPTGSHAVATREHAFAIVDGVVHDWGRGTSGARSRITNIITIGVSE